MVYEPGFLLDNPLIRDHRHIKCDEQKPSCRQCITTKRICEGYATLPSTISSDSLLLHDDERRAFLFFNTRTIGRIFGQQDANNWVPTFVQLGYAEQSVKHAIVALASIHESIEPANQFVLSQSPFNRVRNAAQMLALKHYNKAINLLRTDCLIVCSRPDIVMVICLLFMCFEQLRSGDAACIIHLTAGLKLVEWWRALTIDYNILKTFSRPIQDLINRKIIPALQRLRVQFSLCMDVRHTFTDPDSVVLLPPPVTPSLYSSLGAARTDFDHNMNYMFSNLERYKPRDHLASREDLLSHLHQWKRALASSNFHHDGTPLESCSNKLLQLYYHTAVIIVSTYHTEDETIFDRHTHRFQLIIILGEQLVEDWKHTPQQYTLLFSFDLGITPPMFLVASRCRCPRIRRKAVNLMLQSPSYHGVWRDQYSGICAQRIINIEEQGSNQVDDRIYVPECRRIRKISADLEEDNSQIRMRFIRSPFTPDAPIHITIIPLRTCETSRG